MASLSKTTPPTPTPPTTAATAAAASIISTPKTVTTAKATTSVIDIGTRAGAGAGAVADLVEKKPNANVVGVHTAQKTKDPTGAAGLAGAGRAERQEEGGSES